MLAISLLAFVDIVVCRGGDFPSQSKTDCALKTLSEPQVSGVPIDGLGIQSHYSATPQGFPSKASAHLTMNMLKV
jgi:GH35 family endo-1,4-beta-xylanase